MTDEERVGEDMSDDGATAPSSAARSRRPQPLSAAPTWLAPTVRRLMWQAAGVVIVVWLAVALVRELRGLLAILAVALFFALAMEPAVNRLHARRGLSRGAATGVVFLVLAAAVALVLFLLIPGVTSAADSVGSRLPTLLDDLRGWGIRIGNASTGDEVGAAFEASVRSWLHDDAGRLLGLASNTAGVLFQTITVATFTFYFAADAPRIRRGLLTRLPPERQQRLGWAMDTAIEQTGGYFYSRLILLIINAAFGFLVLVAVGLPWLVALPLAIFQGFFAEFIPAVGTYIGAAVPVLVTLGLLGVWRALVVVAFVVAYQQVENIWLAPRVSARTMQVNGAVAFGAAIAGGALGGPIGAFMALPLAALIIAFIRTYGRSYPLAYDSPHDQTSVDGRRKPRKGRTIFRRTRR